jgi:hypothetical protein
VQLKSTTIDGMVLDAVFGADRINILLFESHGNQPLEISKVP